MYKIIKTEHLNINDLVCKIRITAFITQLGQNTLIFTVNNMILIHRMKQDLIFSFKNQFE